MGLPPRQQRLQTLRDTIAQIERKPALRQAAARPQGETDQFPRLGGGLVQEIFADENRNGGASLGFALGLSHQLLGPTRPVLVYLQLVSQAQEFGMPYGAGLFSSGLTPEQMVIVRPADMVELLWAAEEALGCRAVAAVVAEVGGSPKILDFTASRRLSLRAQASETSIFLLRYGRGREASAAQFRWHLHPQTSAEKPFDARAPGEARWRVVLEKGEVGSGGGPKEWLLSWQENGFDIIDSAAPREHIPQGGAALSQPPSPPLGHRLRQAG